MYERFFGLVDPPFRLTPDPRYLFHSKKHAEALAHLKLGLRESGFVCITGDVGTGKTTLLRAFLGQLGAEVHAAYIFNPSLSSVELLQTICSEFGLPATSKSPKELIDALNAHLLGERAAGRRCVVVVDEAQALGIEVLEQLRLLSNLETTTEKLLRMILVGQPQLRRLLMHPELIQLNQRITLRWHMGPLDAAETTAYVVHRLNVAGANASQRLFTRGALAQVYRVSGGVPRLINMICHRAMLAAFAAEKPVVSRALVRQAHREIEAIPLSARPVLRWRMAATAAGVLLGIGIGTVTWQGVARWPDWRPSWGPTPTAAPAPARAEAPAPPVARASLAPAEEAPAAPPLMLTAVVPKPPPAPALEERVGGLERRASERAALSVVLRAWKAKPLGATEPADIATAAEERGLEYVAISGNLSMLKLFDLPAILDVAGPGFDGVRQVALIGIEDGRPILSLRDQREGVDQTELETIWHGRAHLLWRDFEQLGPGMLGPDTTGRPVRKLQALLQRVGVDSGPPTTIYSRQLIDAVSQFQGRWFLTTDGRVGPLTSIALYAAVGGYSRPTLTAAKRDTVKEGG